MKKILYTAVLSAVTLSLSACGGSSANNTSAANDKTSQPAVETTDSTAGLNSILAIVQRSEGGQMSVETDDGSAVTFDISKTRLNSAWELMTGDEIEIFYSADSINDGMSVDEIRMVTPYELSMDDLSEEYLIYGSVSSISADSITVLEDDDLGGDLENGPENGVEYTLKRGSYETVVGEPKVGDYVSVLYFGELDDTLYSYRICTEDMMDSQDSDVKMLIGTVEKMDGSILFLSTDAGRTFCFDTDAGEELFKKASDAVGKKAGVVFSDSLRLRVTNCDDIILK